MNPNFRPLNYRLRDPSVITCYQTPALVVSHPILARRLEAVQCI